MMFLLLYESVGFIVLEFKAVFTAEETVQASQGSVPVRSLLPEATFLYIDISAKTANMRVEITTIFLHYFPP